MEIDPASVRAHFSLALIYLDQNNLKKSEEMFLRTLQLNPTYRSALYNIGVLYNHQSRVKDAIGYLQQLVSRYPEHLNGAQLLADCYMKTQQEDLAEQLYKHVLRQNPNHTAALHNLGKCGKIWIQA